jgi:hypothetical protein
LASLALSFVVAEAGYRVYLYKTISDQLLQLVKQSLQPNGLTQFDPEIGYHYTPNASFADIEYFKDQFRINQYGFMANDLDPAPYPMQKPKDEYRIALLGDSFTNGLQNYIRWADLVQDYLNRSAQWRERVGGKYTRVLNFGMDGTGIVQWAKVYQARASKFEPDLVIVNFITDDIHRRFVYRGGVQLADDPDIRRFLKQNVLNELPWYELHSEMIAAIAARLGRADRRRLTAAAAYLRYTTTIDHAAAIRDSIAALEQVSCLNPNLIIFHHPQIEELQVRQDSPQRYPGNPLNLVGLETEFLAAAKAHDIEIVQMADRNRLPSDPLRTAALYNLPLDGHNSDYGVALYAQWMFKYLLSWGAAHKDQPIVSRSCGGLG